MLVLQTQESISLIRSKDEADVALEYAPVLEEPPKHLQNRQVIVIDSINSGTGRTTENDVHLQVLDPIFKELGVGAAYFKPDSADGIRQYAATFKELGDPLVIFISGDTSIGEFINGLEEGSDRITIFNIPAGTGNSLSLSLGINSMADSIKLLLFPARETAAPLNLYEARFPADSYFTLHDAKTHDVTTPVRFIVVLSWGFHASLVADSDTPEMRQHGVKRFQIAAGQNLANLQEYAGITKTTTATIEGPYAYWLLTPAKRFEATFEILPKGDIIDESLYFISFKSSKSDDNGYIIDIMKKVYDHGKHIEDERVTYEPIRRSEEISLKVYKEAPSNRRRFCLDGSIIKVPQGDVEVVVKSVGNEQKGRELFLLT